MPFHITEATVASPTNPHAVVQHSTRNSCEIKTKARARETSKWYPELQFKATPLRNPNKCIPCLFDDNSYPIHTTLLRPHAGGSRHFHNLLHTRSVIIDLLSRIFRFLTYLVLKKPIIKNEAASTPLRFQSYFFIPASPCPDISSSTSLAHGICSKVLLRCQTVFALFCPHGFTPIPRYG